MAVLSARNEAGWALRWVIVVIVATFATRLVLAATVGLGIDEAYTVATARAWALGTFDHPPLAWWLAGGAARLFGSENPLAVRAPFIVLFALATWLAFDAGRALYGPRAGLFAAVTINLAPVLGWTSGSMVLPDGPLNAAMLATLCCLARALFGDERRAPLWWIAAGICTGIACLAKLHGVLLLAGTGLFLLTSAPHRRWMLRPWPYLAALVALAVASPFLIWNWQHDWVSFAFQAGRAKATKLDVVGPLLALGGQALFLLPWVWTALVIALLRAVVNGPRASRDWLLFCLAIGPIGIFTLVAITGTKVLFHWAAPGYLMACVLLGRDVARDLAAGDRTTRWWLRGSAASVTVLLVAVTAMARLPWPAWTLPGGKDAPYPLIETQSWNELRGALAARGLLGRANTFVAGLRWHEAARIDVALAQAMPVRCLCTDARGYGVIYDNRALLGQDAIIVTPDGVGDATAALLPYFASVASLPPVTIKHAGQPMQVLRVMLAKGLRDPGLPTPNLLELSGTMRR